MVQGKDLTQIILDHADTITEEADKIREQLKAYEKDQTTQIYQMNAIGSRALDLIDILKKQSDNYLNALKQAGIILESADIVRCEKHPDSKTIKEEHPMNHMDERFDVYYCKSCQTEDSKVQILKYATAYQCPDCGIVTLPVKEKDWASKNSAGTDYHCGICNYLLYTDLEC